MELARPNAHAARKRFCSRCGEPAIDPPAGQPLEYEQRVCGVCGMGVLLRCSADALPGARTAFLVVGHDLEVSAVSEAGESIFGAEEGLLGVSLLDLLSSPTGERKLARTVSRAALRVHEPVTLPARARVEAGGPLGMLACRVSTCGPPRAALVAVEPTHFGRS
jgi:ribosomal protein S27AE